MYETYNGEPVPDNVAELFDPPGAWSDSHLRSEAVNVLLDYDGPQYHGLSDGKEVLVHSEWGEVWPYDRHDYVEQLRPTDLPPFNGPYTYNDVPDVVHHDHYAEHVTRVIVVSRRGRTVLNSRSGVLWYGLEDNSETDLALRLATALSDTGLPLAADGEDKCEIDVPDGFERVVSGWHDSNFKRSQQSDVMNAVAKGELPPELHDREVYPYAVKYGDSVNVCSQPASIYANHEFREAFKELFSGKRAEPARAGFS